MRGHLRFGMRAERKTKDARSHVLDGAGHRQLALPHQNLPGSCPSGSSLSFQTCHWRRYQAYQAFRLVILSPSVAKLAEARPSDAGPAGVDARMDFEKDLAIVSRAYMRNDLQGTVAVAIQ